MAIPSKQDFLNQFGSDYGYPDAPKSIDEIRATEFKRLEGKVYLDHAGATLYSETQMESVFKDLASNVYGNPHSRSDSSVATSEIISAARQQVLDYLNASPMEYKCIFTSGATAALKMVGECFPWSRKSSYAYTMENHNSVLGIREYALDQGATAFAVDVKEVEHCSAQYGTSESSIQILKHSVVKRVEETSQKLTDTRYSETAYNLFAFPSECNFSGMKFPLELVKMIKDKRGIILEDSLRSQGRWLVLIDAAKGCSTEPPDLARYPADFVVFSFYKIFGYPTGLGALVVRSDAAKILNKKYFSGGTVSASIADIDLISRRESIEQLLEDGTLPFLSIASISHGFRIIEALSVSAIARHTTSLATYVRNILVSLKHPNGVNVCTLYGRSLAKVDLGPTIAFNLRRADGSWFGYSEVEKLASLSGIQLRTGCFCNPGACAKSLGLSHSDLLSNIEAGHVCWDDNDVLRGKPTGAVRISFGYMSTFEDAEKFLEFLVNFFIEEASLTRGANSYATKTSSFCDISRGHLVRGICLKSITIYPIKSCSGFSVESWPLSNTGLLYDREWLLKGPNGEILTQKKVPEMCHIRTVIDPKKQKLIIESPHSKMKLQISLQRNSLCRLKEEMDVYGQRYEVQNYDDEINLWFSEAIAHPCTFVRCVSSRNRHCSNRGGREGPGPCRDLLSRLNFANEAQLLLISEGSVDDLNHRLIASNKKDYSRSEHNPIDAMRFRPNLVISGAEPFVEDNWSSLHIGKAHFVSLGGCNRCQMINIDQHCGQTLKPKEPLRTLASYRRVQGKILFGILLRYENTISEEGEPATVDEERWLRVGQEVYPSSN